MRFDVLARQRGDTPLEQMLPAREASGDRIVDDSSAFCVEGFQVPYFDIPTSEAGQILLMTLA